MATVRIPVVTNFFLRCCWYLIAWFIWHRGRKHVRCLTDELRKDATPPAVFVKTAALVLVTIITAIFGFVFQWCWLLTALSVIALAGTYRDESQLAQVLSERYKRTQMRMRCGSFYVAETGS